MIKTRIPFIHICLIGLFYLISAKCVIADEKHEQVIHDIVTDYSESFLLSDATGNFSRSTAYDFRNLFDENGKHVNFLESSRGYLMETDIDTYIQNMQGLYRSHLLLRTSSDYEIIRIENILGGYYEAIIRITSDLQVWQRDEDQGAKELKVRFDMLLQLDHDKEEFSIKNVGLTYPEIVDLSFRLIDNNRKALPFQQAEFLIVNHRDNTRVARHRTSDNEGFVKLSNVHRDDLIRINPPDGFEFVFHEEKTAGDWHAIPENNRLLYLKAKRVSIINRALNTTWQSFITRSQIQVSASRGFSPQFSYQHDPSANISENNPTVSNERFSFFYGYRFLIRDNYELIIGSGASRTNLTLNTEIQNIEYEPLELTDIDGDPFYLILQATSIDESFDFTSWDIPLLLTMRWITDIPLLHSIDVTANVTYHSNHDIFFTANYYKTAKGYYSQWNCTLENIPAYGYVTDKQSRHSGPLSHNGDHLGYGISISSNTALFQNKVFLQPSIGYQWMPALGSQQIDQLQFLDESGSGASYRYIPSMSFGTYNIGSFSAGLGIMYVF